MFHGPDDFDKPRERYWLDDLIAFVGAFAVLILLALIMATGAARLKPRESDRSMRLIGQTPFVASSIQPRLR
jgi:hypothetical protein